MTCWILSSNSTRQTRRRLIFARLWQLRTSICMPATIVVQTVVLTSHRSVTAHDVLAIALRAILYHLCRNRQCYDKLVDEIRSADTAHSLSKPVKYAEAVTLPHLLVEPFLCKSATGSASDNKQGEPLSMRHYASIQARVRSSNATCPKVGSSCMATSLRREPQ